MPSPSARSAPLAALGLLLGALALWGLGRGAPPPPPSAPLRPDAGPPPAQVPRLLDDRPLDLNRATEADLRLLPRIGPALAQRILEDRASRGCFTDVADLARVRGIGERTVERLGPLVVAGACPRSDLRAEPPSRTF